jgi:hypothetical protein
MLGSRIQELEEQLAALEEEGEQLAQKILNDLGEDTEDLGEETKSRKRSPKQSFVNEDMLEPDDGNYDALFNQETHGDKRMDHYLRYFQGGGDE